MSSVAEKLAKKSTRRTTSKQVRLKLVYVDFWSSVKLSFLAAICMGIVTIVATFLILSVGNVMGFAVVVAVLNTVVITALGAVFALLYNLSVKITGGLLVGFTNN